MMENPIEQARRCKVHAFDLFVLNEYLKEHYPHPELAAVPVGGSFLHVFEKNLAPWASHVDTHPGDFTQFDTHLGHLELLHVDIMKNWALTNAVLQKFFKDLIPGVSLVMHQDFVHYNTVWIHMVMYRLKDYFEPGVHVAGSTTVEFKLRSAIPRSLLERTYGFDDFDVEERRAVFAWSRSFVHDPFLRFNIDAAEAMAPLHMGDHASAAALLQAALESEARYKAAHPEVTRRSELWRVKARLG